MEPTRGLTDDIQFQHILPTLELLRAQQDVLSLRGDAAASFLGLAFSVSYTHHNPRIS